MTKAAQKWVNKPEFDVFPSATASRKFLRDSIVSIVFLMSALLNLFRSFPEWSQLDNALDKAFKCGQKAMKAYDVFSGPKFQEFARSNPESAAAVLLKANESFNQAKQFMKTSLDNIEAARKELLKLKTLNDGIKQKRKETEKAAEKAQKSERELQACERRVQAERARGAGSPAFLKAEERYRAATQQRDYDIDQRDKLAEKIQDDDTAYKHAVCETIVNAVKALIPAGVQNAASLVSVGDKIAEVSGEFTPCDDVTIESLRAEQQSLDTEWSNYDSIVI